MKETLNSTKERVAHLLEQFPQLRDDDKLLTLAYWVIYGGLKDQVGESAYLKLKNVVMTMPTFESIRRCRQKLQEDGLYRGQRYEERTEVLEPEVREWAR